MNIQRFPASGRLFIAFGKTSGVEKTIAAGFGTFKQQRGTYFCVAICLYFIFATAGIRIKKA